jgi:hypothetical protein
MADRLPSLRQVELVLRARARVNRFPKGFDAG